jgi:hypothetical protein
VNETVLDDSLKNIDVRLSRVEQYLPNLATRAELQAAIAPLATRDELHAAVALLATKEELHNAIRDAVAPLATKDAVASMATKVELETLRREMNVQFEDVRDDIRIVLEHVVALTARVDARR